MAAMIRLPFSLASYGAARLLAGLLLALAVAWPAAALEPLKQEGRETLYQRILTRPAAVLRAEPAPGALELEKPPAFTVLYVFERKEADGKAWLNVGGAFAGPPLGWVEAGETVAWDQQLLLAFNNPAYRLRNLFFDSREHAVDFFEHENLAQEAEKTIAEADGGTLPADSPVIAIEPREFVDINENFYLLPILSAEDYFLNGMISGKLVEVASIPLKPAPEEPRSLEDFNAAVVFVIDTTISMQPYIDRTREALVRLSEQIAGSPIGERVSFGVVAFRGSTAATPGVEYTSKVFLAPSWPPDHSKLEAALADLSAAKTSTKGFNEDGLAGMEAAINLPDWDKFGGRFIIYVSDAGVHEGKDPLGSTGKNPSEINALAREKQIATLVLHLKTPAGAAYSEHAERQYRLLSAWDGIGPLYFPIPDGAVDAFGTAVDAATEQVLSIVEESAGGDLLTGETTPATPGDIAGATREVGRAMQLAYLGRGAAAPDLFEAWTLDRAMDNPLNPSFEVRVLLNRNQLNDLSQRLEALLQAGEDSRTTSSADFFQLLRSAMASFIADPARLAAADQLGDFLNEYLEALPYHSQVLDIDEATWESSGAAWQEEILSGIRSKLATYRYIYGNVDLWTPLYEGAPANELVYPVPLELLP